MNKKQITQNEFDKKVDCFPMAKNEVNNDN